MNRISWHVFKFFYTAFGWRQRLRHFIIFLLKKRNDPKVFCIGDIKTGTTSLYKALSILGYRAVRLFDLGTWSKKGSKEYLKKIKKYSYDAYVDFPMGHDNFYQKIDKTIPNSKFILTIRDKQSWGKSYTNYFINTPWVNTSSENVKDRIQKYEDRNKQVIEYFKDKPSQFLVMNMFEGDGWEKLCNFLNKNIPNGSFPKKNKGKYKKQHLF